MADTRPELSKRSKYYIPKHRYYELKHFVMQMPEWIKERDAIDSMVSASKDPTGKINNIPDPVGRAVEKRQEYNHNIELCKAMAIKTHPVIGEWILLAVTDGLSYEILNARNYIPCSKYTWYELYHKFFFLLDKARK